MALGDLMASSRFSQSTAVVSSPSSDFDGFPNGNHHAVEDGERIVYSLDRVSISNDNNVDRDLSEIESSGYAMTTTTSMAYLPQTVVLCELRHDGFEDSSHLGPSDSGLVSKWRLKDRMNTAGGALVLCLNISVDPPDVIKISPCARMECWIDPFSMEPHEALETVGKSLTQQYERWHPEARYKCSLDPTVDEVKKLCTAYRKYAKSERVLFHYNGHGVPKPTPSGEIWMFNKNYTQYIPLAISDLDSWLKTPTLYVFDCSSAGLVINAFIELQDSSASRSPVRDLILLAACEAHEVLPQSVELPADVFTSCLTTPIKMALRWLCTRSLLHDSIDYSLIDKIPGRQTDRKTLLGELNWIFTAVTDAIAWNVLPPDLFQKLFRQDLLVASLFRNFLLAERVMRSANCTPVSHPLLPSTHQHHMWDAWDMAAEICLSQLPSLIEDPNAGFQPSPFFTDQLTAFELWLDHGSEHKKPPEQLPIVLQVLLSQCHRFHALVLIGRFLDMGPWAVSLALSVGIFQYVLKLLPTTTPEVRQILVFIWAKILALDKSCQIDLVKFGGHTYFIRFLDSAEAYPEQRAMAAFVLAVIVDGHRRGQEACIKAGLVHVCLKLLQGSSATDTQNDPFFLQWICLCLGKTWEDFLEAQMIALEADATAIILPLLSEPKPEVRASAVFALGTMFHLASDTPREDHGVEVGGDDDKKFSGEGTIIRELLNAVSDGSPLVRAEVAVALSRFAFGHNRQLKAVAASYLKLQGSSVVTFLPSFASKGSGSGYSTPNHCVPCGNIVTSTVTPLLRAGNDGQVIAREGRVSTSSPLAATGTMLGSPLSDGSSQYLDAKAPGDLLNDGILNHSMQSHLDNELAFQCVLAMGNLAKDPSPRVASLGRQVLGIIGIEQVVARSVKPCPRAGDSTIMGSTSLAGIAHSSSWFDMSGGGHLPLTFRTPPVSPPRPSCTNGVQRVCSLQFRPPLINSPDSALADPLLTSVERPGTSSLLPQQMIYSWSCGHFSKPLLTAADDSENIVSRREEREKQALDLIVKCQHASVSKLHNQIASWDTKFETGTKSALFQPFSPVVVASDENDKIRVWNYEEAALLNSFDNNEVPENRGVSKLCLVNELDENLLLVASNNGNIRIWKDYTSQGQQKLVTAFASIQGHKRGIRSVNTVVDWQQQSGYLFASGEISSIMAWDLDKEQLLCTIPLPSDSSISALAVSQVHGGQFAAGFVDGYVRLYDIRTPQMLVSETQPHTHRIERVVDVGFQPGLEPAKIISASQGGDIQFLDMRYARESYLTIEAHRGSLTALAVHRHAPLIASGSAKQLIKVFNLEGVPLGSIRYHPTLMAQKIGPVRCLAFHPYQVLLAAGAADACVSIYADDNSASSR